MKPSRRKILRGALGGAIALALPAARAAAAPGLSGTRIIPSSGETIPAVGLGTYVTFTVGEDPKLRDESAAVLAAFLEAGGGMVDSSPMYGSSQDVIGYGLSKLGHPPGLFSADKVWTPSADGASQIQETTRRWRLPGFDPLQVHNLVSWQAHLETLYLMKDSGQLRYVGITTSHGRRHGLFEKVMSSEPLDFVQLTYNIEDREVEDRLLPLAQERGIAVIVNRPFQRGALIDRLQGQPLPSWAGEVGAATWPQFILKFILSHPAVTVAIPATSRVDHLRENKAAETGPWPDAAQRQQMIEYVQAL